MASNNESDDPQGAHNLEGRYANYFKIGYTAFEFILDFGQYYTEDDVAQLHTRIITSPVYAKTLSELLQECIDQYELDFGAISGYGADDSQHRE